MSDLITFARPYARAAFETAKEQSGYQQWSQMLSFMAAVASDADMHKALDNPRLSDEQTSELFISVCEEQINDAGKNFIRLLAENDRLSILPEIYDLYEQYRSEAEGIIDAEVVSATEVDESKMAAIEAALKKRLGREIKLTSRIDESLMGGAIIHAGDLVIDGSVLGRLNKLSTSLSR